jgi:hypothetical protein
VDDWTHETVRERLSLTLPAQAIVRGWQLDLDLRD